MCLAGEERTEVIDAGGVIAELARGDVRCAREEAAKQMGEVPREGLGLGRGGCP